MREFRIDVPDAVLVDLGERLARTRWPEPLPGAGWEHGLDHAYLRALCEHWAKGYDWRAREERLNRIPQFVAEVDGVDIHFLHVKSRIPGAKPLLMLHGWPGSVIEFEDLIGPLTDPAAHGLAGPTFELVVPSIPGFGFSGKPREPGWGADRTAAAFHRLMTDVLGHRRYGLQGGDWGAILGTRLAAAFPDDLVGLHLNMPFCYPPSADDPHLPAFNAMVQAETGYLQVHNTKPDALTLAHADSPAGLAAWILEKFHAWSDCDGDLDRTFGRDRLITNLMVYWATNSAPSATRLYFEGAHDTPPLFHHARIQTPTGMAVFPKEPYRVPRHWLEPKFNIVSWTEMPRGGHFAALEQPALLIQDIQHFFGSL